MRTFVLLLLVALLARADFDASKWKFRRPLEGGGAGLGAVVLDRNVFAGARADFADLRVLLNGRELPWVLEVRVTPEGEQPRSAAFLDRGVSAQGLEVTLDVGAGVGHNRVTLETPRHNFREPVRLEASDDRRAWSLIRADGAIFDFTQDARQVASLDIDYPASTRRFLRVTIPGWRDPRALSGAKVTLFQPARAVRAQMAEASPEVKHEPRRAFYTFDLGIAGMPLDLIEVDTPDRAFHRGVEIESSADGRSWQSRGWATLSRFNGGQNLTLRVDESRQRSFRLTVYNGDDPPLTILSARFYGLERVLKVEGAAAGSELYYGNPEALAPEYDLARRLPSTPPAALTLGVEQLNPAYREPVPPLKPWTDRHPALLWTILGGAIAILAAVVWKLMKQMGATI